jgi:hypothetical protein
MIYHINSAYQTCILPHRGYRFVATIVSFINHGAFRHRPQRVVLTVVDLRADQVDPNLFPLILIYAPWHKWYSLKVYAL